MLLVLFSAPACFLCGYLAYLCYRRAHYRHTLVLALFAVFLLVATIGLLAAGYYSWHALQVEAATL